jgi:hypothetical protein
LKPRWGGSEDRHRFVDVLARLVTPRSKSYDRELQRQRCENLQRLRSLVRFENKNVIFYIEKTLALLL